MATVLFIPEKTKSLTLTAKYKGSDGKKRKAEMKLDKEDIKDARSKYLELDPYDNAFAVFALTDHGLEVANGIINKTADE